VTCIIAARDENKIVVGTDSLYYRPAGYNSYKNAEKIFKIKGFVIGGAGSIRINQIVRYYFKPPIKSNSMDDYEFMCSSFIDSLQACLKKNRMLKTVEGVSQVGEAVYFLVVYNNNFYTIWSHFGVIQWVEPYAAIGCGENFSLGVLHALYNKEKDKKKLVEQALITTSYFDAGVKPPFSFIEVPIKNNKHK